MFTVVTFWHIWAGAIIDTSLRIVDLKISNETHFWVTKHDGENNKFYMLSSYVGGRLRTRPVTVSRMTDWLDQARLVQVSNSNSFKCVEAGSIFVGDSKKKILSAAFCEDELKSKKNNARLARLVDEIRNY